jgi:hypothetical protein
VPPSNLYDAFMLLAAIPNPAFAIYSITTFVDVDTVSLVGLDRC